MDNPMGGERGVAPQNYGDAFPSMPPAMASGDAHTDAADQTPVSDILTSLEIALTGHSDHAPAVPPAPVADLFHLHFSRRPTEPEPLGNIREINHNQFYFPHYSSGHLIPFLNF